MGANAKIEIWVYPRPHSAETLYLWSYLLNLNQILCITVYLNFYCHNCEANVRSQVALLKFEIKLFT